MCVCILSNLLNFAWIVFLNGIHRPDNVIKQINNLVTSVTYMIGQLGVITCLSCNKECQKF